MKPKYQAGDFVYHLENRKAIQEKITGVFFEYDNEQYKIVYYFGKNGYGNNFTINRRQANEDEIYPSKEELLASL